MVFRESLPIYLELTICTYICFRDLHSLEKLFLVDNALRYIKNGTFEGLISLIYLDLSYNMLSPMSMYMKHLPSISLEEVVDIYYTSTQAPKDISDTSQELPNNNTIISLSGLDNLKFLDLSFNDIQSIPQGTFDSLSELVFLDLTKGRLDSWEMRLFTFNYKLKYLQLSDNYLTTLTDAMVSDFSSENLTFIDLSDNEFECSCQLVKHLSEDLMDKFFKFEEYQCRKGNSVNNLMVYVSSPPDECNDGGSSHELTDEPFSNVENHFAIAETFVAIVIVGVVCTTVLLIR